MCSTSVLLDPRLPDQHGRVGEVNAVRTTVLAERAAKDLGQWEVMAGALAPDARVAVSWFVGTGTDFVESARARSGRGTSPSFHEIGAISVLTRDDRALADASCAVHVRGQLGGVLVDVVSRGRLCWRVARAGSRWLIAGMEMIYLRDSISTVRPNAPLSVPEPDAAGRPSYRYLGLLLSASGYSVAPDLPGIDRPDLIEAHCSEQRDWFFSS